MAHCLEVRHLRLVREIAASGSVTRAAHALHLTQSALSHQLRDVEGRLGVRLFLRAGKRMVLTSAGERVRASAERILEDLGRAEDDLRALATHGTGVLRLCAECHTGYHWLPALLRLFQKRFPGVDVQIVVAATASPMEALLEGRIDLALVTSDVSDRRLKATPLFRDELVAIVGREHPLARRAFIEARDLAAEHLLLYNADRDDSYVLRELLRPAGLSARRVSGVPLTEAILEMTKAGLGVGVLARWAVQPAIDSGAVRALRLTRRGAYREWAAVTLRDRPEPLWQREFVTLLGRRALPVRHARAGA